MLEVALLLQDAIEEYYLIYRESEIEQDYLDTKE